MGRHAYFATLLLLLLVSATAIAQEAAPPAAPPAAAPAPAEGAKVLDTYKPFQYAAPSVPAAPAAPAQKGAEEGPGLDGKIGAGAFLKLGSGLAGQSGLMFRFWPHHVIGLQIDVGFSTWSGEKNAVAEEQREIAPHLGLLFPVASAKWVHFFLDVGGGALIAKEPKEATGVGLAVDGGMGVEIFILRDPHLALEFKGGVEYYSFKAAGLGNGAGSEFATGFTYYFN